MCISSIRFLRCVTLLAGHATFGDYENLGAAVYVINYSECRITDLCFFLSLTRRATDGPIVFK